MALPQDLWARAKNLNTGDLGMAPGMKLLDAGSLAITAKQQQNKMKQWQKKK